jgi:hypothetical protein
MFFSYHCAFLFPHVLILILHVFFKVICVGIQCTLYGYSAFGLHWCLFGFVKLPSASVEPVGSCRFG